MLPVIMTEVVPCLVRVGDDLKKYKIFKLEKDQVTIGRSWDVTYTLLSNMISRCHAVLKLQQDHTWTIEDNKSLNGTHVNGQKLAPLVPYTLQDGDMVQFGVQTSPNKPAEFIYKFYSSLRVRIDKPALKRKKLDSLVTDDKDTLSSDDSDEFEDNDESEKKRKKPLDRLQADLPNNSLRQPMNRSPREQSAIEAEYLCRLAEMEKLLQEKEEHQRKVQEELEQERHEKENQTRAVEELLLKEQTVVQEMRAKQEQLDKEKQDLKHKMQMELEAHVKERETALLTELANQREILSREKKQAEERLQREMEKALQGKNKELEQQLRTQVQKLVKDLEKKDMEQKVLKSQLNETKKESATAKMEALKAREEVLSNFVDLMEMELQCAICNELFIKATSLNCSHIFCKLCIKKWLRVKRECPTCRTPVKSQMQALALDGYINRMVEQLNDEMKLRRENLVEQRIDEQEKFDASTPGPSAAPVAVAASRRRANVSIQSLANVTIQQLPIRHVVIQPPAVRNATIQTPDIRNVVPQQPAIRNVALQSPERGNATHHPSGNRSAAPLTRRSRRNNSGVTASVTSDPSPVTSDPSPVGSSFMDLTGDSSEYNTSDGEDSDYMEGNPDVYYGGYGICFNCGMRGHWANGCPY